MDDNLPQNQIVYSSNTAPRSSGLSITRFILILAILLVIIGGGGWWFLNNQSQPGTSGDNPASVKKQVSQSQGQEGVEIGLDGEKQVALGSEIEIKITVKNEKDEANLFATRFKFPPDLLEVVSMDTTQSFVKIWAEQYYDNSSGEVSLLGGVPTPGYKTTAGGGPETIATVKFKAKKEGVAKFEFVEPSAIFRNSDNLDILYKTNPIEITITK